MSGQTPVKGDEESGEKQPLLSNVILEGSEFRWAFIRKVYSILLVQLALTAAVSAVVVFVPTVPAFLVGTTAGFALCIAANVSVLLVIPLMYCFRQRHPLNFILLVMFTISLSLGIGLSCAFANGKVILESLILTVVVVITLTGYTFWAAKRGHDFSFLRPFLSAALAVLIIFGFIQIFFPFDKLATMIYGLVSGIVFSAYVVYDTYNLIKRFTYDEYIWASVCLHLDVVNIFLAFVNIFRASEK